jgi:hypothetical protein
MRLTHRNEGNVCPNGYLVHDMAIVIRVVIKRRKNDGGFEGGLSSLVGLAPGVYQFRYRQAMEILLAAPGKNNFQHADTLDHCDQSPNIAPNWRGICLPQA